MDRLFEVVASACCSLIVESEDDVTLLRHQLHPQASCASPGITYQLFSRATGEINNHWIFLCGVEVRRADHERVRFRSEVQLDGYEFDWLEGFGKAGVKLPIWR